jgi:hypothetical protein
MEVLAGMIRILITIESDGVSKVRMEDEKSEVGEVNAMEKLIATITETALIEARQRITEKMTSIAEYFDTKLIVTEKE